ncbi:hypothetical protein AG0111_0g11633 [Alternaria gaisen]|uniref:Uncharacterized protein n=1 Tax=Alternaria gaisen TaxID=167740 RepID=A0ACB6F6D2_9PLEO|nr:hypothetical protein AG0111_0g11633 [Alternaria gaisen]
MTRFVAIYLPRAGHRSVGHLTKVRAHYATTNQHNKRIRRLGCAKCSNHRLSELCISTKYPLILIRDESHP